MKYLALFLVLSGCATTHKVWHKAGASNQDFKMDNASCRAKAISFFEGRDTNGSIEIQNACLEGKGWYFEEVPNE